MADPIVDIPTQYFTAFPADTAQWTNAPLGDTTKLQLMQMALNRGSQVLPAEVDAICIRLLGMSLSTALANVSGVPMSADVQAMPAAEEPTPAPMPEPETRRGRGD